MYHVFFCWPKYLAIDTLVPICVCMECSSIYGIYNELLWIVRSAELVEERVKTKGAKRTKVNKLISENEYHQWTAVELSSDRFKLKHVSKEHEKAVLIPHFAVNVDKVFLHFIPPVFLTVVWDSYDEKNWSCTSGGHRCLLANGKCPISPLYICLSMYIRIYGKGFHARPNRSLLRTAIIEALTHLHTKTMDCTKIPGIETFEILFAWFHFTHIHMDSLCSNFKSSLSCIGQGLACDVDVLQ